MSTEKLSLENIGGGVAKELFEREVDKVLENIADINTSAKEARSVNLKVTFRPNDARDAGMIEVKCTSSVAGTFASTTPIMIVRDNEKNTVYQNVVKQSEMNFSEKVVNMEDKKDA